MKVRITKPDGTVIEAEGTAEECALLAGLSPPVAITLTPAYVSPVFVPYPVYPAPCPPPFVGPWVPTWTGDIMLSGETTLGGAGYVQ